MRVVVVGAGLAGLTASHRLATAGAHVTLVEAGSRLGGRARTVRDPFTADQYAESGAEWVDTDHHRMLALLGRHGIALLGEGQRWTFVRRLFHRNGVLLGPEQVRTIEPTLDTDLERFDDACAGLADGIADPAMPHLHPDAQAIDRRSVADLVDELDLGPLARSFTSFAAQGEFADEPLNVSLLFVAQQRAHMRASRGGEVVMAHRVDGGLSRLVAGVADDVAASGVEVSTREPLVEVRWTADSVEVVTAVRTIRADRVVLACALGPMRRVRFDPPLPAPLAGAIEHLGYGTVTKTAIQYSRRAWRRGYANTMLPIQRVYEPTVDQPGEPGVLMAYTGGDSGRTMAADPEPARLLAVAAQFEAMYATGDAPLGGFSRAWSAEPRYGGSYAVYRPGQVVTFWPVLREACGPIHLAGEHVAACTGYLEGAVESGERVAATITGCR